jgi:hypothetical protein
MSEFASMPPAEKDPRDQRMLGKVNCPPGEVPLRAVGPAGCMTLADPAAATRRTGFPKTTRPLDARPQEKRLTAITAEPGSQEALSRLQRIASCRPAREPASGSAGTNPYAGGGAGWRPADKEMLPKARRVQPELRFATGSARLPCPGKLPHRSGGAGGRMGPSAGSRGALRLGRLPNGGTAWFQR